LIAESTGKEGTGILPVVLDVNSPELTADLSDVQVVRLVDDAGDEIFRDDTHGEIRISGTLGAQLLVWEYATAVAGRLLGINPFDQPDVESAKTAARALIDDLQPPAPPAFTDGTVGVRALGLDLAGIDTVDAAVDAL